MRIQKFLDRKLAEHPELRYDGRVVSKWHPRPKPPVEQHIWEP